MYLIDLAELSYKKAYKKMSNIDINLLEIEGMSGVNHRHFINNICGGKGTRYLEVGLWAGSTFCSAISNNSGTFVGIDNWSEFNDHNNIRDLFYGNLNRFKGRLNPLILEQDCWKVKLKQKFNIFTYDGEHSKENHFKALKYFYDNLDDVFVFIVDDWNWTNVREGTLKSIDENNLKILYSQEVMTTKNNRHPLPENARQRSDWHNGVSYFVLSK